MYNSQSRSTDQWVVLQAELVEKLLSTSEKSVCICLSEKPREAEVSEAKHD